MSRRFDMVAERLRQTATTPGRLWVSAGAIALAALLFCLVVAGAVGSHRRGMQTIGKDAAPSIIAAEGIKADLAEMHSEAANQLLVPPGEARAAEGLFEKHRLKATEGILTAAGNVTYETERLPLRNLVNALGRYELEIGKAFVLHEQDNKSYLLKHQEADKWMREQLLPAATALDTANGNALNEEYKRQRSSSHWWIGGVAVSGALLIAVLLCAQMFLYRRTRRVFNPGLLLATLLAAGFLLWTLFALVAEQRALKQAKEDAFDSIHALWQAKADAYDANGEESRWLLVRFDQKQREGYERAFRDQSSKIVTLDDNRPPERLLDGLKRDNRVPDEYDGYLIKELNNITFAGEREAATDTLKKYLAYYAIDGRIRQLDIEGKHAAAVNLCVGDSNTAFAEFDKALDRTIAINQKEFDQCVTDGLALLDNFRLFALGAALGVVALTFLGLRPRLREYAP